MANLSKNTRSTHSPSPIYGDGSLRMSSHSKGQGLLRPGFNVGDLDRSYQSDLSVYGTFVNGLATAQTSTADASGTAVATKARVVKVTINVTGTGTVDISAKTQADTTTVVFDSGALSAGSYEFYVGGWSSPTSNSDATYLATQYGPVKSGQTPSASNPTGDEETNTAKVDTAAFSNYVGGTYNPVDFLSLDGFGLTFFSVKVGTASWDVAVAAVS